MDDSEANYLLAAVRAVEGSDWRSGSMLDAVRTGARAAVAADRARTAAIIRNAVGKLPKGPPPMMTAYQNLLLDISLSVERGDTS